MFKVSGCIYICICIYAYIYIICVYIKKCFSLSIYIHMHTYMRIPAYTYLLCNICLCMRVYSPCVYAAEQHGSAGPPIGAEAAAAPSQRPPGGGGGDRQAQASTSTQAIYEPYFYKKICLPLFGLIRILCWICTGDALHNPFPPTKHSLLRR